VTEPGVADSNMGNRLGVQFSTIPQTFSPP
jgi:hypothetical protein